MPYTIHGWWHGPGQPTTPGPRIIAKCGGPGPLCAVCSKEAADYATAVADLSAAGGVSEAVAEQAISSVMALPHPVGELRTAATKLRKTAAQATDGPWYTVGPPWNDHIPYVIAGHPDPHCGTYVADPGHLTADPRGNEAADAEWMALVHPGLAEPLAAWLEQAADAFEDLIRTGCADAAEMIYAPALRTARVINRAETAGQRRTAARL